MTLEQISKEFSHIFFRISLIFYIGLLAIGYYFEKNTNETIFLVVLIAFHWAINKSVTNIKIEKLDIKENMFAVFENDLAIRLLPTVIKLVCMHYAYNVLFYDRTSITPTVIAFVGSMVLITLITKLEKRKILKLMQQK